jgi:two-component system CheB/CheR fusion protein
MESAAERVHPDDRPRIDAALRRAVSPESDGSYFQAFRFLHADGSVRWVESRARTLFEERHGKRRPTRIVGVTLDVTERRATERALSSSEDRYRVVIEASPVGFTMLRAVREVGRVVDFTWLHMNPSAGRLLGVAPETMVGRPVSETFRGVWNTPTLFEAFVRVVESRRPERLEVESAAENVTGIFSVMVAPYEDGVATWFDDVTARKKDEAALRVAEARWRTVVASMPGMTYALVGPGRPFINHYFYEYTGCSPDEPPMQSWTRAVHPDDAPASADWVRRSAVTGEIFEGEIRFRRHDGAYRWFRARGTPQRDPVTGRIAGWFANAVDVHDLKESEQRLAEADRRKDEFLATLAHELRNPLAALSSASHVVARSTHNPAVTAAACETLVRQVEQMSRLLDDLLDVSRITRGKLTLRRERVALGDVVEAAVDTSRPAIEAKRHRLVVDVPRELELAAGPLRLGQVLANLLVNAAKYTDPGGTIALRARVEGDALAIEVSDDGIGIAPAALPRIFDMFSQVHSALERADGGLGIGLALTKGLVEMHGGRIAAASEGPGRGSTFTVRLPLGDAQQADAVAKPARREPAAPKRRILLVDDNRDALESLALLLGTDGHEVITAHDGPTALERLAAHRPEIVLLDLGMPIMDGYECAQRMRETDAGRDVAIVAVSGWGQAEHKRRTEAAGFDHHLTKPVDWRALRALLAAIGS